ncbi:MAG: recombinase family protein [Muribaculaceae bacterium]|nr:recombinase family protein [Muribaculaceae bacterium]
MTKTAVIYARYSSDSQSEQSIDGQLRVCEEYAQRNNILILNTYIDRAMTGTNDNRPDFQKMIKDSANRTFEYVLVYKLDRFSRNKYETAIHKKTLRDNGVKVLSAMENIPDTPEGIILESLLEGMNQYYSAELSQKVKRGMRETRLKGNYQGGGVPYGYKVDGRKIVIDEERAENVRFMYAQFAGGVYVKDIITQLTVNGKQYKGKPFAMNTVYNILKNQKYLGVYQHGEEIVDNMYPQIVERETFEKVQAIINANKHGKRSIEVVYLLRHKLKCGYCGQSIIAEMGTARNGERKYYYKCRGRKARVNDCKKQVVQKDVLEKLIIDTTIQGLSKPEVLQSAVNGLLKLQESKLKVNTALNNLLREQRQIETALQNLVTAIENGIMSNTTNKRLHELEHEQQEIERRILIERSKTTIKYTEKELREYFEQSLRLEPQMLINYFIKEIVLYDDKIEIHYNSPIPNSPDDNGLDFLFHNMKIINNLLDTLMVEMYV